MLSKVVGYQSVSKSAAILFCPTYRPILFIPLNSSRSELTCVFYCFSVVPNFTFMIMTQGETLTVLENKEEKSQSM